MRIGFFLHRLAHRHATGISRYGRELLAAVQRRSGAGDSIVVASTRQKEQATWIPPGIRVGLVPWPRRPTHAAWCLGAGPRIERATGPLDVVHLLYPFPPARSAAPQLLTVHDVMPLEHPDWYPRSEVVIYRRCMSLAQRRASQIVVPSQYAADRLAATLGLEADRMAVVPEGVSGIYTHAGSPEDISAVCARVGVEPGDFIVSVGAVSTRKNLIPLIRAMAALPDVPLVVVGPDGYGAAAADAELARLSGTIRAHRTGYLSDADTAALVRSAAVLVHPSLEEGFGLVPLEAMAVGTPVIATRASSIPEVVGDAALLVEDPSSPDAWAAAIGQVLESTELRASLVAAGAERVSGFTWERAARMMLDLYRDAADAA